MKKFTLVLGGGGARGFAHIGVIKVLEKNGLYPSHIVGTSMGALVGAYYALYKDVRKMEQMAMDFKFSSIAKVSLIFPFQNHYLKSSTLTELLNSLWGNDTNIENLQIPFAPVSVDLKKNKAIYLEKGNLTMGVQASISIPVLWKPIEYKNMILVDGGVLDNVPSLIARQMGLDNIIAVDVVSDYGINKPSRNKLLFFYQVYEAQLSGMSQEKYKYADLVIKPKVSDFKPFGFNKEDTKRMIELGEKCAESNMDLIKNLLK